MAKVIGYPRKMTAQSDQFIRAFLGNCQKMTHPNLDQRQIPNLIYKAMSDCRSIFCKPIVIDS